MDSSHSDIHLDVSQQLESFVSLATEVHHFHYSTQVSRPKEFDGGSLFIPASELIVRRF
jgi:hypothetical protein